MIFSRVFVQGFHYSLESKAARMLALKPSFFRVWLLASFIAFSPLSFADHSKVEDEVAIIDPNASSITPTHCITTYPDQPCDLIVTITWPDDLSNKLCLYQGNERLDCWNSDNYAFYVTNITLASPTPFTLKTDTNQTLVSTEIRVSAVKNKRRRLRPRWSIF